jgi:hypothetical protein
MTERLKEWNLPQESHELCGFTLEIEGEHLIECFLTNYKHCGVTFRVHGCWSYRLRLV